MRLDQNWRIDECAHFKQNFLATMLNGPIGREYNAWAGHQAIQMNDIFDDGLNIILYHKTS